MLRRLLPMEQNQKKNQNQQENQELQQRSPNLLFSVSTNSLEPIAEKYHLKFSHISKILIVIIQVAFGVLIAWDSKTKNDVEILQKEIKSMETQLKNSSELIVNIDNTVKKIEKLKELQQTRPSMLKIVSTTINSAPNVNVITQTHIHPSSMEIVTETDTALEVSLLINNYLKDNLANEITIKAANLSKATNKYVTSMGVVFK